VALKTRGLTRRLLLGLLFGFIVVLALVLVGDLRQVSQHVLAFRWGLFPLVLGLTLFNYILRFVKWHYYLKQVGVQDLPVPESARLFVAGFPLAVTPGKVGEALKGVWLNQKTGLPVARGVAVVLAERISDGLGVLALSTLGVIAYPRYWPAFAAVLMTLLVVIVISQIRPLALMLLDLGEKLPLVNRFAHALHEFYEGSYALFRPKVVLVAVSLGTLSWLGEGVGLYVVLLGLGVPASSQTLFLAVFILAFSTVIGAVSTLPGGLGASEASIAGMLGFLLALPAGESAAATLLIRFATLWFGVGLGLLVWTFSGDLLGMQAGQTDENPGRRQALESGPQD
jgi:uncharacterized protein (TIRG00374 family)